MRVQLDNRGSMALQLNDKGSMKGKIGFASGCGRPSSPRVLLHCEQVSSH
uniref:Uncharacterized protein n=1 Tax=Manihot esculenta TaxID=3983 RepID=A0A2C9UB42_MANES